MSFELYRFEGVLYNMSHVQKLAAQFYYCYASRLLALQYSKLETRDAATVSIVEGRDHRYGRSTMGSEKYKLKWSKYESNILAVFSALLESETLSDVSLFCEG